MAIPGRCPACGLTLDEYTRVWRSTHSWQHHAVRYGLLGLLTGLAAAMLERSSQGSVRNPLLPILTGVAVAVLGLLLDRALTGKLSERFVAVTPEGILLGLRPGSELVPWADFRRVMIRGRVPKLERHSSSNAIALEDVFDSGDALVDFVESVRAARQRYVHATAPRNTG